MKLLAVLCFTAALCSCAAQTVQQTVAFDIGEAQRAMRAGHAIIEGSALIRQNGGGVVSCAGTEVTAVPVTAFSRERMFIMFNNDQRGFRPIRAAEWLQKAPPEPPASYVQLRHRTVCDAQGNFQFTNVAAGSYYVLTDIYWSVPGRVTREGGGLLQQVTVSETDIKRIVLSP